MLLREFLKRILKKELPETASAEALALHLYQNHFTRKTEIKSKRDTSSAQDQKQFIEALYKANSLPYVWIPLELKSARGEKKSFSLDDLSLKVSKNEWKKKNGHYQVKLPGYSVEQNVWYRFFAGNFQKASSAPLARVYFNCTPKGTVHLLKRWSAVAAREGFSFGLKLGLNLENYNLRNDNCILYYRRSDKLFFARHIGGPIKFLRPENIPLTRVLAPGVCYAEDPADGSASFGMHRCRLIAMGLHQRSSTASFEENYANVVQVWKKHGFDPEKPWQTRTA